MLQMSLQSFDVNRTINCIPFQPQSGLLLCSPPEDGEVRHRHAISLRESRLCEASGSFFCSSLEDRLVELFGLLYEVSLIVLNRLQRTGGNTTSACCLCVAVSD